MGKRGKEVGLKHQNTYRKAKEVGYRARSSFKLLQIQEQFDVFSGVTRAVDLCAAPGSWSQVLSQYLYSPADSKDVAVIEDGDVRVVAVDLQEMAPIPGVKLLQGDITARETAEAVIGAFDGQQAQLVVCDGAPDVTGLHQIDEYLQSQLLLAALNITTHLLAPGGSFAAKFFKYECYQLLERQLSVFFEQVHCFKPSSSRPKSAEHFVVCLNFRPPKQYRPALFSSVAGSAGNSDAGDSKGDTAQASPLHSILRPFLTCGDLSGYKTLEDEADALTTELALDSNADALTADRVNHADQGPAETGIKDQNEQGPRELACFADLLRDLPLE